MIRYPYLPKGKEFLFVPESNRFMRKAKTMAQNAEKKFPWVKWITASVIVKNDRVIAQEINRNIHFSFCPRRAFDSPSGKDYELCPRHCHPENHSEARATKEAGKGAQGADLYMYGHWWCCNPCWDKMIRAGIKNVFLIEKAAEKFYYEPEKRKVESPKTISYYNAGPLTKLQNQDTRTTYEEIASLLAKVNVIAYLPHRHSDPIEHPKGTPKETYQKNKLKIKKSDFVLAYLGEPSLGVGIELELANVHNIPVIGYAKKGERISRMALGSPALEQMIFFENMRDLISQLSQALEDILR